MSNFLQLHLLTSYPPACLNRDDLNRPKSAKMGGVDRLRISSQCLKRAWRTSEVFREQLTGETGIRSKELGLKIRKALLTGQSLHDLLSMNSSDAAPDGSVSDQDANEWAWMIAAEYVDKKSKGGEETDGCDDNQDGGTGNKKGKKASKSNVSKTTLKSEQIVFYSLDELKELETLINNLRKSKNIAPSAQQLACIKVKAAPRTADLAMFGRMLASSPDFNVEAACQVAHAITVHRAAVEDDFFTAVDDLNNRDEDAGSAHLGEQGFGAGLFYHSLCVDCDRLRENLGDDAALAQRALQALIEAAATVAPSGKQNSYGSRAWAYYVLAEKGERQPRALSLAFMKPVTEHGDGMLSNAVFALETMRTNLDKVYYGGESLDSKKINGVTGQGDFQELKTWAAQFGSTAL